MRKRNIQIIVRLNNKEEKLLKEQVKCTGLTVSSFIRMMIKGYAPKPQPPLDYHKMMGLIYKLGNNINQIAACANHTGHILADEYEEYTHELSRILLEIQTAVCYPEKMQRCGDFNEE